MPTVFVPPTNVYTGGLQSTLPVNQGLAYGTIASVLDNTTICLLQVFHSSGAAYQQPNISAAYPCSRAMPAPQIQPVTGAVVPAIMITLPSTSNLIVGTVTSTFFDRNDGFPTGYPSPIVSVSNGQLLVVSQLVQTGLIYQPFLVPLNATGLVLHSNSSNVPNQPYLITTFDPAINGGSQYTFTGTLSTGASASISWLGDVLQTGVFAVEFDGTITIYAVMPA